MSDPLRLAANVPNRVVMWNVEHIGNSIVMYALFALSLVIAFAGIYRRVETWRSGKPAPDRTGKWAERFYDLFRWSGTQKGVNKEVFPAIFHSLIYLGFLVLTFTTTMVAIDHDLGIKIYHGDFYLLVTVMSDLFGLGLFLGILLAAHRRYVVRADLVHNRLADSIILSALALLVAQGFVLEALRIHATNDPWAKYSIVGFVLSKLFWGMTYKSTTLLHFLMWWFHAITVFALFAIVPYTKFFHIVSSSANLYFRRNFRPKGQLPPMGDIEKLMETAAESETDVVFGLGTLKDYSWKNLLDLDACTSCGRCQDACPAYRAGTPLSPKWIILDTRNHMLGLHAKGEMSASVVPSSLRKIDSVLTSELLLNTSGLVKEDDYYVGNGAWRADNPKVQESVRKVGGSIDDQIAGTVMNPEAFWSCTTCYACVNACPVGINHVDQIIGNRRNLTLMQGEVPQEAQPTLRALENRANPYGAPSDRSNWTEGLGIRIVQPGDSVDYLYWVGCVSAFDPRKQKIAKSLVAIMKAAGLSFGILGNAEGCTGDPARRLGEENLFQTMAKSNIELLKSIKFETLVANCPHCFNTIRNEYPEFGNLGDGREPEIIHHSVLLRRLLADKKLALKDTTQEFTFHDPCYLGRYNNEYEAPRETLKAVKGLKIIEMEESREKGMCCGAGGGHFWMDLKLGDRINALRTDHAAATGAGNVATACPFCMQMMEDGVKLTHREESMVVKDIAEVIAENLA